MIKLSSLKLNPGHSENDLKQAAAKAAGLSCDDILSIKITRRSVEARKKETLSLVYSVLISVKDEAAVLNFFRTKRGRDAKKKYAAVFIEKEEEYCFPFPDIPKDYFADGCKLRPVIIGSGPAGLLCAYELALHGYKPIIVERGLPVRERKEKVERFFGMGELDPECNIQFGEGGAGTFSDGKLNTGVTDRENRAKEVLNLFVRCGASEDILYDAKPHVGSDVLYTMVQNLRKEIESLGGEYLFGKRMDELIIENGNLTGIRLSNDQIIRADTVVLAIGHSARDTFEMLYEKGVKMMPKAFAVGVRCEHDQERINISQWGEDYPKSLGAASYKLTHRAKGGRSVYTFCMCPGGEVLNASSEEGMLCVNGMSLHARNSGRANSAVIVSVTPADFEREAQNGTPPELSGVAFQRKLEQEAFLEGNGHIPAQRFEDFLASRLSTDLPGNRITGKIAPGDLNKVLPGYICEALAEGIIAFDHRIFGFSDTVLYGVETRTSSPVRILRDESFQSSIRGLYPCGEGAGYAGGIMSAAIDGIKTAEQIAKKINDAYT